MTTKTRVCFALLFIGLLILPLQGRLRLGRAMAEAELEFGSLEPASFARQLSLEEDATPDMRRAIASMVPVGRELWGLSSLPVATWSAEKLVAAEAAVELNSSAFAAVDEARAKPSSDWERDLVLNDSTVMVPTDALMELGRLELLGARTGLARGDSDELITRLEGGLRVARSMLEEGTITTAMVASGLVHETAEVVVEALDAGMLADEGAVGRLLGALPEVAALHPKEQLRFETAYMLARLRVPYPHTNPFGRAIEGLARAFDGDAGEAAAIEAMVGFNELADGPVDQLPAAETVTWALPTRVATMNDSYKLHMIARSLLRRAELAALRAALGARLAFLQGREWIAPADLLPWNGAPLRVRRDEGKLVIEIDSCERLSEGLQIARPEPLCKIEVHRIERQPVKFPS